MLLTPIDPGRTIVAMLKPFWFRTDNRLGYGVTARSEADARALLAEFGYPRPGESIIEIISGVSIDQLDQHHVVPNAGPIIVRGVWYPKHNV